MKPNPIAENVLGTMGQIIPQIWKTYKDKKSDGLSPWLMLIWGISSAFSGAYAILILLNLPLQLRPQLDGFFGLISWGQCLYYNPHRQNKRYMSFLLVAGTMISIGGFEVFLVFISKPAYERGVTAPVKLYGVLSTLFIAAGLLPQYWEIYKRKEVVGISYLFIFVDILGGLLNDLSLLFAKEFDGLAAASYTIVISMLQSYHSIMDSAIFIAALILNPRARRRRRETTIRTAIEAIEPGSTGIAEPTAFTSPTSTLDIEKQDNVAEFGKVTEEKKSYGDVAPSTVQQADNMLPAFTSSTTIRVLDIEEGSESPIREPPLDKKTSVSSKSG
ncbi:hypothetical protein AGABI1DRAFT_132637 [Agaricus bisporus var. burnettii JB137-S8]|uniref:PQ-loop-domain-containing protein n=1 Tax=Agaricus bisporus var. burnettii (strain JB137-S8 / ATCC MYA-4627 / FGSC 10392) TaxID=597362 RepID=K5WIA9_AGABU|nr:uncharacterized protein AGABI1DRAFT_132637 [Agaricus bisporus var. burnettii JB137-S8]EKM75016.1 hypothetical protein AGABI1DRAFT_132637 [Agaricus bisporus var. burnettii JB137-S8]